MDDSPFDLSLEAEYTVAAKNWIAHGGDQYTAFTDPSVEWLVRPEEAKDLLDIVEKAFEQMGPNYTFVDEMTEIKR